MQKKEVFKEPQFALLCMQLEIMPIPGQRNR